MARSSSSHRPSALGQVPALLPEPPDRPGCLLGPVGLAGLDGPAQAGPEVGVLQVQAVQPLALVGAAEVGPGGHGQVEEPAGVPPGDLVQLAGGGQPLPPELADRLQHGEPRAAGGGPGGGQRGRRLEGVEPERLRVADGLGRGQRPAAAEHRQPGEEPLLGGREQVVAPGDGAAQGPLAVREGAGPAGQQRQAALEPGQDLLGGQDLRRHHQLLLAPERERDAGGHQHVQARRGGEQLLEHRAGVGHLLEVVRHQ
jgi:hypothetical protein